VDLEKDVKDQLQRQSYWKKTDGRLNMIRQRKHSQIEHVFRSEFLLQDIIEGRMKGRMVSGRRRLDTLRVILYHQQSAQTLTALAAEVQRELWQLNNNSNGMRQSRLLKKTNH